LHSVNPKSLLSLQKKRIMKRKNIKTNYTDFADLFFSDLGLFLKNLFYLVNVEYKRKPVGQEKNYYSPKKDMSCSL